MTDLPKNTQQARDQDKSRIVSVYLGTVETSWEAQRG